MDKPLLFAEKTAFVFQRSLTAITSSLSEVSAEILQPFFIPILTLYFIILGYQIILGNVNIKQKDVILRIGIIIPLVITTIFNVGMYMDLVSGPIVELRTFIVSKFSILTGQENMFKWIDTQFLNLITNVFSVYLDNNIFTNFINYMIGIILLVPFFFLYVYITMYSLMSLVLVGLLLLIGPMFLFFLCFNLTKNLFFLWLRSLMTYWLYAPLIALMMVFVQNVISISLLDSVGQLHGDIFTVFTTIICIFFVKMIPEIANSLTQGVSSAHEASNFTWSRIATQAIKKAATKGAA